MKKQHISRRFVGLALIAALTLPAAAAAQANVKQINARFGVQISVNGVTQHLTDASGNPVQAFEYNGTTYVPIRGVAQALGAQVGYDASTDTASITDERLAVFRVLTNINDIASTINMQVQLMGSESVWNNIPSETINLRKTIMNMTKGYVPSISNAIVYACSPASPYAGPLWDLQKDLDSLMQDYEKTYTFYEAFCTNPNYGASANMSAASQSAMYTYSSIVDKLDNLKSMIYETIE